MFTCSCSVAIRVCCAAIVLVKRLLLGLLLREPRIEAFDADRQLPEIAQQNQLLAGAFGGRNVLRPITGNTRFCVRWAPPK